MKRSRLVPVLLACLAACSPGTSGEFPEVARTKVSSPPDAGAAPGRLGSPNRGSPDEVASSETLASAKPTNEAKSSSVAPRNFSLPVRPPEGTYRYAFGDASERMIETSVIRWTADGWRDIAEQEGREVVYTHRVHQGLTFLVRAEVDGFSCTFDPPLPIGFQAGEVGDEVRGESRCGGIGYRSQAVVREVNSDRVQVALTIVLVMGSPEHTVTNRAVVDLRPDRVSPRRVEYKETLDGSETSMEFRLISFDPA